MLRLKVLLLTVVMVVCQMATAPSAEAGPLLDWLRGLRRPGLRNNCCQPPAASRQVAQYQGTANPYGLQPGQCARTCNKTCSRVVVNYVPTTAYRTSWKQVPVTQYKAQTSSDPCTGCSVTCMRPCTSYTWQMQRVPYTTYRQVYRTENYTVPVTTITNDCATGTCGTPAVAGCATGNCGTSAMVYPAQAYTGTQQQVLPQSSSVLAPNGTLSTGGNYVPDYNANTGVPADSAPFISPNLNPQNSQRPIIDRIETLPMGSSTRNSAPSPNTYRAVAPQQNNIYPINNNGGGSPAVINFGNQTADASPIRKKWSYTPVRLASYTSVQAKSAPSRNASRNASQSVSHNVGREVSRKPVRISGSYQAVQPRKQASRGNNSAWETVEW